MMTIIYTGLQNIVKLPFCGSSLRWLSEISIHILTELAAIYPILDKYLFYEKTCSNYFLNALTDRYPDNYHIKYQSDSYFLLEVEFFLIPKLVKYVVLMACSLNSK